MPGAAAVAVAVVVADDHVMMREAVRHLLGLIPGIHVVGEAADGDEALRASALHRPDVVVMDVSMPRMGGIEACRRMRDSGDPARVVIVSMHATGDYVKEALDAGARGYVLKDAMLDDLGDAVTAVMTGEIFLGTGVARLA